MITDKQKQIYNLYIRSTRVNKGKPFKYRKNWDNFNDPIIITRLAKIEKLFEKYPHFFCEDFFDAPYKLTGNTDDTFGLKWYTTHAAIAAFVNYARLRREQNPDEQLEHIKNSIRFIAEYCISKKITLDKYATYQSVVQPDCLIHLKEHKISWYLVFDIPGLYNTLYSLAADEFALYFGDVNLHEIQIRLKSSTKAQRLINKAIHKLKEHLYLQKQSMCDTVESDK